MTSCLASLCFWFFVLALPLTLPTVLNALIYGAYFSIWHHQHIYATTDKFLWEMKGMYSDWGLGEGVSSFREWQDTNNDFGLMRINSNDWARKLGFMLPNEYGSFDDASVDARIDQYADLTTLVRNTGDPEVSSMPKEQWLWLTAYGFPRFDPWDNAFHHARKFATAPGSLNSSGLFYAECSGTASFLCGVWATRPYTLVHFLVEDEAILKNHADGFTYAAARHRLHSVTVRIVSFPLHDTYTGLASTVFPGHEQQVLSIMTGECLYEQFEPYDPSLQILDRYHEYYDSLLRRENSWLRKYEDIHGQWYRLTITPLGLEVAYSETFWLFFSLVVAVTELLVLTPMRLASELRDAFLGRPLRGDAILDGMRPANAEPANILDDLFGAMLE